MPFLTNESALLADGSLVTFSVHDAMTLWDSQPRRVYAHLSETTPLVGMRMLENQDLSIQSGTAAVSSSRPDSDRNPPISTLQLRPLPSREAMEQLPNRYNLGEGAGFS